MWDVPWTSSTVASSECTAPYSASRPVNVGLRLTPNYVDLSFVCFSFASHSRDELAYIVRERVSHGGPGALLEACQEAEAKYA